MVRFYTRPVRYILPVGGALFAGAVGIAAYTTYRLKVMGRRTWHADFNFSPWEVQVPFEPVSFETEDGLTLRGWWFPQPTSQRVIIGCTGHRGAKHELLGIGSGLWRAGSNVLLFDFRSRGDSDVAPASLAHHELHDARAAVRFVQERLPGARIGMIGYSMGAAVALLTAAIEPAIQVVVADSPFATIRDLLAHAYQRRRLPSRLILELSDALNRWRYGYPFEAVRPIDAVEMIAPRPVLIIHGAADTLIPVEHAYRLYAAASEPKELWIVEDAAHCGAYFMDRPTYVTRVGQFYDRYLAYDNG
jgi:fermentation-respiration switch protein FrsA (DUF1100 family)